MLMLPPHASSSPAAGAYNVATGLAFGIPMPVQPMKTIAAVALSQAPLTVPQVRRAGDKVEDNYCNLAVWGGGKGGGWR
jgi:hypothetical protein